MAQHVLGPGKGEMQEQGEGWFLTIVLLGADFLNRPSQLDRKKAGEFPDV